MDNFLIVNKIIVLDNYFKVIIDNFPKKERILKKEIIDFIKNIYKKIYIMVYNYNSDINIEIISEMKYFNYLIDLCYSKRIINNIKYYILKIDIKGFFSNINLDILKAKLAFKIKDKDTLSILYKIIDSYPKGLPIGLYTSQLLSIFYLNELDHYIKEDLGIKHYIRYQDDMVIFGTNYEYLKKVLEIIKDKLKELKLEVNNKTKIYKYNENINFLGRKRNSNKSKYYLQKRKLKTSYYKYNNNEIKLNSLISSINSTNNSKYYKEKK